MEHAYAVFFDKQKIHFISEHPERDTSQYSMVTTQVDWNQFRAFIRSGSSAMACVGADPSKKFRQFASMFHVIEAAGGLVTDPTGYWLFIYRRNRWDLPKGMIDKGETPEQAALREVREECGIGGLKIIRPLEPTYHVYPLKDTDNWALKKTHWFFMRSDICCQAEPQTSEGITKAEWKNPASLDDVLQSTYGNIRGMVLGCQQLQKRMISDE